MRGRLRMRHRVEGQAVVLAALAMVVLLGLAGLAVDGAFAYDERRQAANSADAAALEGARALSEIRSNGGTGSAILSAVEGALDDHGLAGALDLDWTASYTDRVGTVLSEITSAGTPPSDARGVLVDVNYRFETFIMPVLGQETLPAAADATAIYGPLAGPPFGGDLLPLGISYGIAVDMQNNPDDVAIYGLDAGTYQGGPGDFGALELIPNVNDNNSSGPHSDCTGGMVTSPADAPTSAQYWWCNGTPFDISVGDELYTDPGTINGVGSAVQYRIVNRPLGLVPIYDYIVGNGNNRRARIVGFMAVRLTDDYQLTGNDRYINAEYIDFYVTTGAINPNPDALDTGVYAINLIN